MESLIGTLIFVIGLCIGFHLGFWVWFFTCEND